MPAKRWHNPIPAGITMSPSYHKLPQTVRHTLQGIADRCDRPLPDGSLIGAFGGTDLVERLGVCRRTFWNHVERLTHAGFLVVLSRGGSIGGRPLANCYGIPSTPGALEGRRAARRMQRMVRGADGKARPQVIDPGAQVTLWPGPGNNAAAGRGKSVRDKLHYGSAKVARPPCKSCTVPSPVPNPNGQNHGGGARRNSRTGAVGGVRGAGRGAVGGIGRVSAADLRDTGRLLGLFPRAVARGWLSDCDRDRLRFVAAAEHALRCAKDKANPGRLFVALVRSTLWMDKFIGVADERRAQRRLAGCARRSSESKAAGVAEEARQTQRPAPSRDARLALAAIVRVRVRRLAVDPVEVLRSGEDGGGSSGGSGVSRGGWTRDRWDRAVAELDAIGRLPAGYGGIGGVA